MTWASQWLRAVWRWRWPRRLVLALAIVGVVGWLWRSGIAAVLWEQALAFFVSHAVARLLTAGGVIATLFVWLVPKWQVRRLQVSQERRFELESEARKTLAQVAGGAAFLVGLYFTAETLRIGQETLRVNQEGQITERFTKAVEQLSNKDLHVRLGGVYALERIARDSERDRLPITEVLTAYVRDRAPIPKEAKDKSKARTVDQGPLAPEIQAILKVLARRTWDASLDLHETNLGFADLSGANLRQANLYKARLHGSTLEEANLRGANLGLASLVGAKLQDADLQHADLRGADLSFANLLGTKLKGADLRQTQLAYSLFLTQDQINHTLTDQLTRCPIGMACGQR